MRYILGIVLGMMVLPLWAQGIVPDEEDIIVSIEQPEQVTYTWNDFVMDKPCSDDFYRLQNLPFLSQKQQQLKDKMQTYCLGYTNARGQLKYTAWDNLLNTFRQNKRVLLLNKKQKENGKIWGAIKAIPTLLFDVYQRNPQQENLANKLDYIQEAIYQKDPNQVMMRMQLLLPDEQILLTAVFNEARALADFKEVLAEGGNP
ncbi:MAG: hypothetical protein J6T55_01375 [Alphaproteobacteria bacterium]|nr:hypothetical protein [Alphaproteobacteria bacterium]